ncbi:hypothetical protein GCM10023152_33900 [Agromyces bauzanensis]|uniref:Uncharacterized protein n=1 Tax=Agromyces bauzanensis TaxID=1308924 RepID=A0A917UXZ8_9MICO|nr:hypothetical protein GCM10011372_36200 [Agromyces bauzanensis]
MRELAVELADDPPDLVVSNAATIAPLDARNTQGLPLGLAVNYLARICSCGVWSSRAGHVRRGSLWSAALPPC